MKTILITDDQPHLLIILEYNLAQTGCCIIRASSGEEALTKAQARPVDMLIADVDLPGIDGIETTRRLRKLPGYAEPCRSSSSRAVSTTTRRRARGRPARRRSSTSRTARRTSPRRSSELLKL